MRRDDEENVRRKAKVMWNSDKLIERSSLASQAFMQRTLEPGQNRVL
jgi:hypothetical protein